MMENQEDRTVPSDKSETPSAAHTPGPWRYEEGYVFAEPARPIASVEPLWIQPEGTANGYLIAAAPDMLATLRAIQPLLAKPHVTERDLNDMWNDVKDAIAKATP